MIGVIDFGLDYDRVLTLARVEFDREMRRQKIKETVLWIELQ